METKESRKTGHLPKLHPEDISLIKGIRFIADRPCGKRLHSMPAKWSDSLSKRRKMDQEVSSRILSVSPATLDRVLSKYKADESQKRNRQTLRALKQSIPIIDTTRGIDKHGHLYADGGAIFFCKISVIGAKHACESSFHRDMPWDARWKLGVHILQKEVYTSSPYAAMETAKWEKLDVPISLKNLYIHQYNCPIACHQLPMKNEKTKAKGTFAAARHSRDYFDAVPKAAFQRL